MNIIWGLCWGGSKSTKPCVFPYKVAAAGDERRLLCAAVAAAVIRECVPPRCFLTNAFLLCILERAVVPACVILYMS